MADPEITPTEHFQTWHYEIRPELWSALGVTRRERIDMEPTKTARKAARERGLPEKEVSRIAVKRMVYAHAIPPVLDFHEGDIFYPRTDGPALQVICARSDLEVHLVEIHLPGRMAYRITPVECAKWLRTGAIPHQRQIGRGQSWSEILRFQIVDPTTPSVSAACEMDLP